MLSDSHEKDESVIFEKLKGVARDLPERDGEVSYVSRFRPLPGIDEIEAVSVLDEIE